MTAASSPLVVPGYDVLEMVGFGGSGEVWRATETATGELVALKRLRSEVGDDPAARDRLRREAALLSQLAGPHVLRLRGVLSTPGGPVLALDFADGGSLAGLLARRGRLTAGEVVTLGVPLARTLAELHERGVVHGDLSPSNVLFTADGRPLLADLGVARLIGAQAGVVAATDGYIDPAVLRGSSPSQASDVYALGVLLTEALTGKRRFADATAQLAEVAPAAVVRVLLGACSADPLRRPAPLELASALRELGAPCAIDLSLRRVAPPSPVRVDPTPVTAAVTPAPREAAAIEPRRRRLALPVTGLLVAALVGLAVVAGLALARGSASEAATAAPIKPATISPSDRPVNWMTVMTELDAARDDAFAAGDPEALAAVYVPGSEPLRTETARLRALLEQRLVVRGLDLVLLRVTPIMTDRTRAVVEVVDRLPAYDLLDAPGRLVARHPERGPTRWRVELERTGAAWRIGRVSATS